VFLMGEPVPEPVDHPIIRPSINAVARTYDLAVEDPELARLAQDLAGGLVATLPSQKDFESPVTGPLLRKFLKGRSGVATEARVRILRLIENMTMGRNAVGYLTESMHGAGSPQAQRIQIERGLDLEGKKKLARDLAGIKDPEPPPSARRS
jgi:4-hydroxybutyryl-CoA dehydratase/vinylacetyl-CoA-Delta-isomerase